MNYKEIIIIYMIFIVLMRSKWITGIHDVLLVRPNRVYHIDDNKLETEGPIASNVDDSRINRFPILP